MKKVFKYMVFFLVWMSCSNVWAHHSFSATYDASKQERIEGTIEQFLLRNPHSMIHVVVAGEDGETHRYTIEWAAAAGLGQAGITRTTLRIGDRVIVTGNPGRNVKENRLRMIKIERPIDGWSWGGTFD